MWHDQTAKELGLDPPQLQAIIRATAESKAEMDRLNGQVQGLAGVIHQNMNSDAGKIMNDRLTEWTGDYNTLAGDLQALNTRVIGVQRALQSANQGAAGAAHGGRH